jgi:glutathione S-transferase
MILYGSSLSPFVRKVLAYCGERGIEIELQPTGVAPGTQSEDFIEASPFKRMPALRDGDYTLADSSAIIHYLEAKYPDRPLIPAEPQLRGKTIWFEEMADTILGACCGKLFYNRVVAPRFLGRAGDEEIAETAERDELPPILKYLEAVVPADGRFLVGNSLTLADISIATMFVNLHHLGITIDEGKYPRTAAYVDGILARPSFAPWVEREAAFLAKEPA